MTTTVRYQVKRNVGRPASPYGVAAKNSAFLKHQNRAHLAGIEMNLDILEYISICEGLCVYCGIEGYVSEKKSNPNLASDWIHNGIDRVDSHGDYTLANSVTSCPYCNVKKSTLSLYRFYNKVRREFLQSIVDGIYDEKLSRLFVNLLHAGVYAGGVTHDIRPC